MNARRWTNDLCDAFRRLAAMEDGLPCLAAWPERNVARALIGHKVSETAASLSLRAGTLDGSPFAEFLKRERVHHLFKLGAVQTQIRGIADVLARAGIEFVLLKGPLWSQRSFPPDILRHLGDIDLLVRKEARDDSLSLLYGLGYLGDPNRKRFATALAERGHVMLIRPDQTPLTATVELHWEPLPSERFMERLRIPCGDFFADCSVETFAGCKLLLPPPELRMAFIAMHGACQHQFQEFLPALDTAYLLRAEGESFDWTRLAGIVSGWNGGIGLFLSLAHLDMFGGLDGRAGDFLRRLEEQIPWWARRVVRSARPEYFVSTSDSEGRHRRRLLRLVCSGRCAVRL